MRSTLVLMAYGTPGHPDEVEAYYTHIRRGRPPTPELLAELQGRYDAIGGLSPLRHRTQAQADGVQAELDAREPDRWRVVLGMKHTSPFIEDAVDAAVTAGTDEVVGLVLAPHHSAGSVQQYLDRLAAAVDDRVPLRTVGSWHDRPALARLLAERLVAARAQAPRGSPVLFTAHSLPTRVVDGGDRYPELLLESASAAAAAADLADDEWQLAYQSAGRTPEPWLGPDVLEVVDELAAAGAPGVVVCPQGFVSDHLEVLYDIDIELRRRTTKHGMALARTTSLNDDPTLLALLADLAEGATP